jgi:ABC-2 type transport system ATP-binding protein
MAATLDVGDTGASGGNAGLMVDDIVVRRGDRLAVDGLRFGAHRGQVTGLLGPNGAGKTSTFGAITSLLPLERGHISVDGRSVGSVRIGYAPQAGALYPYLSGVENARAFAAYARIPRRERREAVAEALAIARLDGREHDRVGRYSGGMRQRLSLAIATLGRPDLLLLDEPTVGVDPQARLHLLDGIRRIAETSDAVVVFSSHYLDEVEYLCDRAVIVDHGRAVVEGTLAELHASSTSRIAVDVDLDAATLAELGSLLASSVLRYAEGSLEVLTVGGDAPAAALLRFLGERGIVARRLCVTPPGLDEVFFGLTGAELRD